MQFKMNKLTISLLLVGLFAIAALARTSPQIRRPYKFTPGQTYIYEYRGRQWNGAAHVGEQYAGLTLECDVVLQALPDSTGREVLMKLDDIKVEQLHTQKLDSNDVRILNQGKEQNVRQTTMYKEELSKPIRFTYLDGKIVRFIADSTDAEWSINIKKSLLSLFQLDLAPSKIIKSSTRQLKEQVYGYNAEDVILTANEMPLIYPIYEESFGGICETLYEIDSVDNVEQREQQDIVEYNDVLNVTKTVNYKNCLTDPSVSYDRHSFNVNTQTIKGKLFTKQPTVTSQNYYPVPEELKSKYSNAYTSFDHKDNVASPVPVERYSWTKYNIASAPQSLVDRRFVPVSSQADMSLIETVFSEGKIKYQVDGDTLVSETQQNLKLISVAPTSELARLVPELSTLAQTDVRQPSVEYHTIQCELNSQKVKFYQALLKFSQLQQSLRLQNSISNTNALYSHQLALPFALSASWYPIVATGQQTPESSFDRVLDPEELAKSYEHLLNSLADDILTEDVAQSKKAGEKVIRLVNIIAFMPKYKLVQIYDNIVDKIQAAKKAQLQSRGKQAVIDNDLVSKNKIIRKLFLDSLPLAGSKQAIEMIEVLIETNRVKAFEAKEMCEAVPTNLRYPDTEIIDAFIRISQLPAVRKNRSLFASCSIAAGKMIGQSYAKSKDASYKPTTYEQANKLPTHLREDEIVKQVVEEADPRRQLPLGWNSSPDSQDIYDRLVLDEQDLMKYVKFYKSMLNKANQYHEKVVYIETLAHMKLPQVIPILEPYVTGRLSLAQCLGNQPLDIERPVEQSQWYNYYGRAQRMNVAKSSSVEQKDWDEEDSYAAEECNYMRTIAIYALAHVSRSAPDHVQALLLPVFDNTYEPYQIRIAAFTSIMLTPVPEHVLERIASQMWREQSKEVASFVVGCIDTISKMTAPSAALWKHAAMKAAQSMPKQYLDTWKFSWMAGGDHFDYSKDTGLTWAAELVKSNVSSIPRAGYVHFGRYHGTAGMKYDNHFQFGFTSKGLESLFKDYIAYNQQQSADNTNIIASIFENLYDTKDDLVKYYREARDSIKESILSNNSNNNIRNRNIKSKQTSNPDNSQDATFFLKTQQPIDGVNTKSGKQARKTESLFDGLRSKRSITFKAHSSSDDDEEAKLTIFSKLFDSTSYHALDKKEILALLEKSDDYIKMVGDELIMGGKLHYVRMMMPSNMWHMVPSQMGLPIIVTHRRPIVASIKIDGSQNGQLTSNKLSQYYRQQATGSQVPNVLGQNFATSNGLNITALVHPKIMHSNYRFMFAVEQANNDAYGVQCEKSHQMSLPMEVSVAYSQAKKLVSFAIEPKTPARMIWTKEAAKTFIAPVALANRQVDNWLGQEHLVRSNSPQVQYKRNQRDEAYVPSLLVGLQNLIQDQKDSQRQTIDELETPYKFDHRFVQQLLGLEFNLEGVTDDENVVRAVSKSDLSDKTRGQLQWTSTDDIDDLDQHSKSGPAGDWLHILGSALNRPSKYLEYYTTMRPVQSHQSPVYRFDFVLSDKTSPKSTNQFRRPNSRISANAPQVWQSIEQNKMLNKIPQSEQMLLNVY